MKFKKHLSFFLLGLFTSSLVIAQEQKFGVFYKIERSKVSEGKGIMMDDIISNQYHLGMNGDKLVLTFSNSSLIELFFLKKNVRLVVRDTNSSKQY